MGPTPSPGIHSPLTLYPRGFPGGGNQLKRISLELRAWALGLSGALRRPLGDWETWLRPVIEGTPSTTSADTRKKGHISASPPHRRKRRNRAPLQHCPAILSEPLKAFLRGKATQQSGMTVGLRPPSPAPPAASHRLPRYKEIKRPPSCLRKSFTLSECI